jgi:hypothetical protein
MTDSATHTPRGKSERSWTSPGAPLLDDRSSLMVEEVSIDEVLDGGLRRDHLARASAIAVARRAAMRATAPLCRALVRRRDGTREICRSQLLQNLVEQERGVWWCSRCRRYTDGSDGFPVGHPLRPAASDHLSEELLREAISRIT